MNNISDSPNAIKYDPNRPDIKNFDSNRQEIERLFNFIYDELAHDEKLSGKEFKETLRTSLSQVLDTYESMKPYVLYNRLAFDVMGAESTFSDAIFEVSEMWLSTQPEGYTENEADKRIDQHILQTLEWRGLNTQVHYHDLKSGK